MFGLRHSTRKGLFCLTEVNVNLQAAVPHFASNKRHNEQQFGESGTGEKRSRFLNRKPGKENENPSSSYDQGYFTKESGVPYSDSGRGDSIYYAQPVQADPGRTTTGLDI